MPERNGASVSIVNVRKSYGALQALRGVSLEVRPGAVHGLIGPNGSGKSTLMKCLAGVEHPDAGEIRLDGDEVGDKDRRSSNAGIVLTPQELTIAPRLSVIEHVVLGVEPSTVGFLRRRASVAKAVAALDEVGLRSQMHKTAGELSVADRRLLMVASSVARGGRVVILDEPTAGIPHNQRHYVLDTIATLARRGTTVLLVTHHVDEIVAACSEVTMLQDGEIRGSFAEGSINRRAIVDALLGGAPQRAEAGSTPTESDGPLLLELENVSLDPLEDLKLTGHGGEIVGIAGIPGSGLEEAVNAIAGVRRPQSGAVRAGKDLKAIRSPVGAVRAGVSFVSGNRKAQILPTRSIAFHTGLESLSERSRWGFVSDRREREVTREALAAVGVNASVDLQLRHLSGGNQQRALLAKTIIADASVVLVHEPTVGVDIAARLAVRDVLRSLAARGALVVVASADPEELLGLADRVICLRQGHVQAELSGPEITTAALVEATV